MITPEESSRTMTSKSNRSRLYQYYRLLIVPAILWYVWVARYAVIASEGETLTYYAWARAVVTFGTVPMSIFIGFLIMRRLPGNVIGPALIVLAAVMPSEIISDLTLPTTQESLNEFVLWSFMFPSQLILLSHFPGGRIKSDRAAIVIYAIYMVIVAFGVISLIASPTSYGSDFAYGEALPNPFMIAFLKPIGEAFDSVSEGLLGLTSVLNFGVAIYSYFQANLTERKQMRWMIVGFLMPAVVLMFPVTIGVTATVTLSSSLGIIAASSTLPVTIGIGILFYRLWDIDVIIRRTFTYAILSALLVGVYLLIVLIFQNLLSGVIASDSSAVIVISTLTVAVLFNPLRERVQRVIDRIFYRKHYDATLTLEHFSENIRHATEAEAIEKQLIQSISSTIQPKTITIWKIEGQP